MKETNKFTIPQEKTEMSETYQILSFQALIENDIDVLFVNCDNDVGHEIVLKILCGDAWEKWIDSSKNSAFPPDFYSTYFSLMMEVMTVNDVEREEKKGKDIVYLDDEMRHYGKMKNKLVKYIRNNNLEEKFKDLELVFFTTDANFEHSYGNYIAYFRRVVLNHIGKIKEYRNNHPGMKLIFFIYDMSEYYQYKIIDEEKKEEYIMPHEWFTDERLLDIFRETDVDYLIWFTPYKRDDADPKLPLAVVFDLKKPFSTQHYEEKYVIRPYVT